MNKEEMIIIIKKAIVYLVISALIIGFLLSCLSYKGLVWTALGITGIFCSVIWIIVLVFFMVYISDYLESN